MSKEKKENQEIKIEIKYNSVSGLRTLNPKVIEKEKKNKEK